jgi:hypothetical protein
LSFIISIDVEGSRIQKMEIGVGLIGEELVRSVFPTKDLNKIIFPFASIWNVLQNESILDLSLDLKCWTSQSKYSQT